MQLVAYGAQDIYLTGNPQITFFKVVYRRHTNFSMETIEQTLNGGSTVTASSVSNTATISRNGDLVHKMHYRLYSDDASVKGGEKAINKVELEIGGQRIDEHYGEWIQVFEELNTPTDKAAALKYMKGSCAGGGTSQKYMLPLQFWFCRNPGLALPLIALQYHEVKVKTTWNPAVTPADNSASVLKSETTTHAYKVELWAEYIYLDTDERRRFAQVSHEYLIEQVQRDDKSANTAQKLNFNHPVKELIWTTSSVQGDADDYDAAILKLNGHDRFSKQETEFFTVKQPFDYHSAVPGKNIGMAAVDSATPNTNNLQRGIIIPSVNNFLYNGTMSTGKFQYDATGGAVEMMLSFHMTDFTEDDIHVGDTLLLGCFDANISAGASSANQISSRPNLVASVTASDSSTAANNVLNIGLTTKMNIARIAGTDADAEATDELVIYGIIPGSRANTNQLQRTISVYSFALKPEEHQPSGTCNFSRIDNAEMVFDSSQAATFYAVNYNVLRIMSGMGGLAYSN